MGRKRKKRRLQQPRTAAEQRAAEPLDVAPESGPLARKGRTAPGAVALVALAVVALAVWTVARRGAGAGAGAGAVVFPPPLAMTAQVGPTLDDFAGADACAQCHQREYAAWRGSTHGRAGGIPSRDNVIANFDGRPIRFQDAVVIPSVSQTGEYTFTVRQQGHDPVVFPVAGVVGGGHMVGGGTQGFLSAFTDGTLRFLPFDFIRREGVWFCNTNTRTNEGWVEITEDMLLADCGDWPPLRVFGTESRFANCQECHGSQIVIRFDQDAGRYETRVRSLSINCESCHGPAMRHVELAQAGELGESTDLGVRALGLLDEDASLEVCFQCHALKEVIAPGYLPGKKLQDHYALLAPLLGDRPFFPDGRVRTFAYQINHLASACYLNGTMNCVDCHEPHGQGYRDIYGRPLASRFSNEQCTSCHASKAVDLTSHTHHPAGSPGSECVSCHMPYLQQQEVGDRLRFARSDHTIPIPRPAFDTALGVENACSGCHQNSTVAQLQDITDQWYGEVKPHKDIVSGMVRASRGETSDPALELLHPDTDHPMAQVAALTFLIADYLRPDMPALNPEVQARLEQLADNHNVDVRAVALASLHYAAGDDPTVRAFLAERLASLGESDAAVRQRWALTLGYYGDAFRESADVEDALVVYHKALEVMPEHAGILRNLGLAHSARRDYPSAIDFFERSLASDPQQALAWVNLGIALEGQGQDVEAAETYRRALQVNATEALAYFNLGNLHLRRDEFPEAIAQYQRAVTFDPGLALGHYYLGRALIMVNDLTNALTSARRALEFEPTNEGAREMVAELERVLGGGR